MKQISINNLERHIECRSKSNGIKKRFGKYMGLGFIAPWLIAFIAFEAIPILSSFYHSFTNWSVTGGAEFIGFSNYNEAFTRDTLFWKSVTNTLIYIGISVPLTTIAALLVAMLLNTKIKGMAIYRSIYYLPSIISSVAAAMVWIYIFDSRHGLLNYALELVGIPAVQWLSNPDAAKPALIIMTFWTIGVPMVIYLAGLQGIPGVLYEAAEIDGATGWQRFKFITIPLITPTIYFNFMMNLIKAFQIFNNAFIMTAGGPNNSTLFYMLNIYNNAFRYYRMGYASALAVILFIFVLVLTIIIYKTSDRWVFYG